MQPDVGGLLGAVDGQRHAPFAGQATDVGRNRLAAARVHAVDAVHALEHVAGVGGLEALEFFTVLVDGGDVLVIHVVMAFFVGAAFTGDGDFIQGLAACRSCFMLLGAGRWRTPFFLCENRCCTPLLLCTDLPQTEAGQCHSG